MKTESRKKRIAAVGTGNRLMNFTSSLVKHYLDQWEMVALCDLSQKRMDYHNDEMVKMGGKAAATYLADKFEVMLEETKPDALIVCTTDATHDHYVNLGLRHGVDIICEKPLTINAEKCNSILDTVAETGGRCRVTFNCRFRNAYLKVKELVASGVIGNVKAVHMEWLLNTSHGADYFRRWHATMAMSGGLLVHKSTHHFDLVNWWVDGIPETVFAFGQLDFYGKKNAVARGEEALTRYDRYAENKDNPQDPFHMSLSDMDLHRRLYQEAEEESGYIRDRNVFRDDIDIYDNMSVTVRYRHGPLLSYSLVSFSPREGLRVSISGDKGRIEFEERNHYHLQGEKEMEVKVLDEKPCTILVCPLFQKPYEVEPDPAPEGGHGGSDPMLAEQIFDPNPPEDRFGSNAGHEQGAASLLIGAAANVSIASGQPVKVLDLVKLNPKAERLHELV